METPVALTNENEYLLTGLQEGNHIAGVQSVYTSGTSDIVTIDFEIVYPVEVTVEVTTNSGDNPVGAWVELINSELPQYSYTATVDSAGLILFPQVRKGTYNAFVTLENFYFYEGSGIVIQENMVLPLMLQEFIQEPFNLMVTTEGLQSGQALFSWNNEPEFWIEGFETGELPDGWSQIITNTGDSFRLPCNLAVCKHSKF
jgi:hypothetical protein